MTASVLLAGAHWLLVGAYMLAPLAMVALAARASLGRSQGEARPAQAWTAVGLTAVAGFLLGGGLTLIYARLIAGGAGAASPGQYLLAGYVATGLLALLKGFDVGVRLASTAAVTRLMRRDDRTPIIAGLYLASLVRVFVLLAVGLPWVMAAVMVYRPKVVMNVDPLRDAEIAYEAVRFNAADGSVVSGWWMPAGPPTPSTVLVIHGLGSGKADLLPLSAAMRDAGHNVLSIDLRAHGESGGQIATFGALEARDVAAAAAWLRQTHPQRSERLLAVAASMGGAATLRAAAEGTHFHAVAILGSFDSLPALADDVLRTSIPGVLRIGAQVLALPIACLHTGANLYAVNPADDIGHVWPAPVLIVHGEEDEIIPFARGRALYEAAFEPRRHYWVARAGHVAILTRDEVYLEVAQFFVDTLLNPPPAVVLAE